MKNCYTSVFVFFFLFLSTTIFAQDNQQVIHFANGDLITGKNIESRSFNKTGLSSAMFENRYFVAVQFSNLPSLMLQDKLKKAGIDLFDYLPGKAYLATVRNDFNFSNAASLNISSINEIPSFYKIDKALSQYKPSADKQNVKRVAVSYYPGIDRSSVVLQLQKSGAAILPTRFDDAGNIFIQYDAKVIPIVAALPFISSVSLQSITDKPLNYNNVAAHGISGLHAVNGKNLNGSAITIGIGDNADISTHTDFTARLINRSPWIPADHGTHVSGTAAGAGIINVKNRGMAPKATIISQYFSDIIVNTPAYIIDNNMVLTNNSYYSVEIGCAGNGKYDVLSNYIDAQMKDHPQVLHVVASGNDGTYSCGVFPLAFATVKSGWQSAKNVLTVGSISTEDFGISYFSSRGPVKDGRLKPEITAGGWAVMSTNANDSYGINYGTSMASPVVTGSLALMYERYRQKHGGADPKAALMKTLACNTAEDLGNPGPDFTYGFGMLNAARAVEAIDSNRYIINAVATGATLNAVINVPANSRRLKVMLYWADNEAATNAAFSLVNDLDLTVTTPSALVHQPLILNPAPATVDAPAVEGADHTNNIEQVVINNPAAGNYTIRVNGFLVPAGVQEYIISYEIDKPSVKVDYPSGGEKLVPGETENIRWTAYGNEANNFTVEYSNNNGNSWSVINNNVPNTARRLAWPVPAALTNAALIRVSRNATGLTGSSNFNFTVLGSPVVVADNVCQGAVQLTWSTVAGATSYDVMQLVGDSMQVIANTTTLTYLVKGLDKNKKRWFGVAAKNAAVSGRRSVSVSMIPNGGACSLAAFNNDLKVDSILEPASARKGFSNAANATKPVKVQISNTGSIPVPGPFSISFRYGSTTVTETVHATIAAGGKYIHTFTGGYSIVPAGFSYHFKSWVTHSADNNHLNDTAYKTVKYINNDLIVGLPFTEGFETMTYNELDPGLAIGENKYVDFSTTTERGRARSFVNTGFSHSGTKALTLDQAPYNDSSTTDTITLSYNLSNFTGRQLRFDFYYKNHGQADAAGNKIWIRGSESNNWVQALDLFASQAALGEWAHGKININEVLDNAVPAQMVTPTFQLKIGQEGNNSANSANAVVDLDDGYTFDDLVLNEATNDVAMIKINSPTISDCALSSAHPVSIRIKNYNNAVLNNLQVSYQVNGGTVITEMINALAANQTLDYVFTQKADLSAYIDYNVNVWVKYATDSYAANDSILNFVVHNSPVISSYPYLQNFENSNGFFYTKGTNSSWEWGHPDNVVINKAANGSKAWVTGLTKNYKDNETSYLYSPCFNLSGLSQPMLSFSHIFKLELNYDYSWVEYSTNGLLWQKLGTAGAGTNWYDNDALTNWTASKPRWHVASIPLPAGVANIRFRFVMSSDGGVTEEGIGIDDIHVFEKAPIYEGAPVTGITQNVVGNDWVNISSGGKRIVSVNPNGLDLGATNVQVHPLNGAIRNSNEIYYANRNIVVRPSNTPAGRVGIRFYFTEKEALDLANAAGCDFCAKPIDPYELGITQYTGSLTDENSSLADDLLGVFRFIVPDSTVIVPYDNGYYAEFYTNGLSEFWLSTGNIKPAASGACAGENIFFSSTSAGNVYQWQEDRGTGFSNISDDAIFSGTNTEKLELANLPTNYSGVKYRCIRDGVAGAAYTVRFTNVWNGAVNSNWFLPANWSCGTVPDQYTDVVIPGGLIIYPLINANTSVRRISVQQGATVTVVAGIKLDINGNNEQSF